MSIESIHIDGFGCLSNVDYALAPGLNVFYGSNEVGKSTLQQAIWAFLYGFYKTDRRARDDNAMLDRFRPWHGEAYGGYLVYRLDNGKTFRVRRSFEEQDQTTAISEADTGREITNNFVRGKLGRVDFAHEHFGMSEEVFINTCFVRQADLHHLAEAAQAITETVINLAGTGRQDRSVAKALAILQGAFGDQVGSARARKKPLPLAQEQLVQLLQEKQRITQARQALELDYEQRGKILRSQEQANRDLLLLQYIRVTTLRDQASAQLEALQKRLTRKQELSSRLAELGASDDAVLGQRETVLRLNQAWNDRRDERARVNTAASTNGDGLGELKRKRQALAEKQLQYELARNIPIERESVVRELQMQWRDALSAVEQVESNDRMLQERIEALKTAQDFSGVRLSDIQSGQQKIQSLRIDWETTARGIATAEQATKAAETDWQTLTLPETTYTELQTRLAGFSFETLTALKSDIVVAERVAAPIGGQSRLLRWIVLAVSLLVLIGGAMATLAGLARGLLLLDLVGAVGMLLGLVGGAVGVMWLLRPAVTRASASKPSVSRPMDLRGFGTVADLEAAYHRVLRAQAPYENLLRTRAALEGRQAEWARIERDTRALLDLNPEQPVGVGLLTDAHQTAQVLELKWNEQAELERQTEDLTGRLRAAREHLTQREIPLKEMLTALSIDGSDVAHSLHRFYELCDKRREWDRLTSDLGAIDAELKLHLSREGDANTATLAEAEARRQLLMALSQLGIGGDDPQQAFKTFEAQYEKAVSGQGLRRDLETQEREIRAGLAGQSEPEMQRRFENLTREANSFRAALGDQALLPEPAPIDVLELKIEDVRHHLTQYGIDLATVEQRLAIGSAGLRSLAEVEEEVQSTETEIGVLETHGQALELAMTEMQAAADEHHRNFLPQLNQIVGRNLGRVTGGRYPDVQIDHADLQIRLQVPGNPIPVIPDVLSRGAQELIYLLLRLGLTELMSNGHERLPLVLDDPLVNLDQERLVRGLELLAEMATHTQVLLFTKDLTSAEWIRARTGNGHHLLEL